MAKSIQMQEHARKLLAHQEKQASSAVQSGDGGEPPEAVPADPAFLVPAGGYVIRKRVTMPVLPFPTGATYVLRIVEAIRVSEVDDSKFGPAKVCQVESPQGEARVLIVGEVLGTALGRTYPNDGYVGAWFQITKLPPREGKRYADYAIVEIEPPMNTVDHSGDRQQAAVA